MTSRILEADNSESVTAPGQEEPGEWDERKLLEGLRQGSEEAYEALIRQFQQPIYNLVYRLLEDPSEAGDVVQEVFLKIFRKVGSFRGDSSLRTWIYRIAVNQAYNHQRWFNRHRRQEVELEGPEPANSGYSHKIPDRGPSPFDCALEHEQQALIEAALARLNPSFRAAVVLRDIEELSYEEIAEILQVALGTVKSRIQRGREALRRDLAERLEPEPTYGWTPEPAQ
ncbi:MAG: sigma-70 family RNA polymerase sigma factor [Bryobacterales bacterium]|nr:sigma-70 family RNA polymerase sigma factor [Bryobacteraceae bacterium]MDW8131565.1 sigma-70 family RNA polymerase sigma factor [Bryobacterales bacterium]